MTLALATAAPTSPPAQWTRLEKIQYLLDQWDAIFDPGATSGIPGGGEGIGLLPLMSRHPSVVELSRCLDKLLHESRVQYAHVKAYRCDVEWRIRTDNVRRKIPNSKRYETIQVRRRERLTPPWVRLEKVRRGERFLADAFQGEVFIPGELWDALTKPAMAA